jgi:hypothetical protein
MCAPSRDSRYCQDFLQLEEQACPEGTIYVVTGNLSSHDFAGPGEIAYATRVATAQLNARARPWVWGRPEPRHRCYRRRFVYIL